MRGLIILFAMLFLLAVSCDKPADTDDGGAAGLAGQMSGGTVGDADADTGESSTDEEDY